MTTIRQLTSNLLSELPRRSKLQSIIVFCPYCGRQRATETEPCRHCATPALAGRPRPGYGGFWRRAVAMLLDFIILTPSILIVRSYLERPPYLLHRSAWVSRASGKLTYQERESLDQALTHQSIEAQVLFFFLSGIYFVAMECSPLQGTFGKRILQLKVTDLEGRRIGLRRAIKRHFGRGLSGLMWGVGFIMAAFTARKRAFHDLLVGTVVVIRPKASVDPAPAPSP